jgi:hypothetical protein
MREPLREEARQYHAFVGLLYEMAMLTLCLTVKFSLLMKQEAKCPYRASREAGDEQCCMMVFRVHADSSTVTGSMESEVREHLE